MVKEKQTAMLFKPNDGLKTLQNYLVKGYTVAFVVPQAISVSVSNPQYRDSKTEFGNFLIILNNPE